MEKASLIAESAALKRGAEFLNRPGIDIDNGRISGYEYKKWTPCWIPFIQASTGIWNPVTTSPDTANNWQNGAAGAVAPGAEHLPFNIFIPSGGKFDFQLFTPKDHPFLLCDVKVAANLSTTSGSETPTVTVHSRFKGPFQWTTPRGALFRKYAYPDNENIYTTITAVSPGGKPVWGGVQNVVGMDNDIRTVGPVPHTEVVPLANSQCHRSGKGALQHHLLFPCDGIIRVTVENHNVQGSAVPTTYPDGAYVNGVAFGYVIME